MFSNDTMTLIRKKREVLAKKVNETINKYGPKVFRNFDKMKLVKNLKPKVDGQKIEEKDSEVSSQNSFYYVINEVDFDDAFNTLNELGL